MQVFYEWQNLLVARKLYEGQKSTSEKYYEAQIQKKAFLALNFYRIFLKKQKYLKSTESGLIFHRLCKKAIFALVQYA